MRTVVFIVIHYRASELLQSDEDGSVIAIHYRASELQAD